MIDLRKDFDIKDITIKIFLDLSGKEIITVEEYAKFLVYSASVISVAASCIFSLLNSLILVPYSITSAFEVLAEVNSLVIG